MKYDFDTVVPRGGTSSTKWEFMSAISEQADKDTIPMWVADMDFYTAPKIVEAMHTQADVGMYGYTRYYHDAYLRSVGDWLLRRFDWYVNTDTMVFAPGIVPALGYFLDLYTQKWQGIIIQTPIYYPFIDVVKTFERTMVENALIEKNGEYTMNFDLLEKQAADENTVMMFFCTPHNPVGRVWTKEEIERVIKICKDNNVILISDEIHADLLRKGQVHIPTAKLAPKDKNIITCTSPTKTFNLAGLRISNIIIPEDKMRQKWKIQLGTPVANPFGMAATFTAYNECEDWCAELNEYLNNTHAFIKQYLQENLPLVKMSDTQGTYLAWLDVRAYTNNTRELEVTLCRDAKLLLEAGERFGEVGKGFIRLNFGCPISIVKVALERLKNVLLRVKIGDNAKPFKCKIASKGNSEFPVKGAKHNVLIFMRSGGYLVTKSVLIKIAEKHEEFAKQGIALTIVVQNSEGILNPKLAELPVRIICNADGELYEKYYVIPALYMSQVYAPIDARAIIEAKKMGVTSEESDGNNLQLPAVFVFDEKDKCTYAKYGTSGTDLPTAQEIINIVKGGV